MSLVCVAAAGAYWFAGRAERAAASRPCDGHDRGQTPIVMPAGRIGHAGSHGSPSEGPGHRRCRRGTVRSGGGRSRRVSAVDLPDVRPHPWRAVAFVTAQAVAADGASPTPLSLAVIGDSDDPLIVAGELRRPSDAGRADESCRAIATRAGSMERAARRDTVHDRRGHRTPRRRGTQRRRAEPRRAHGARPMRGDA